MSVILRRKDSKSLSNWKRMLSAYHIVDDAFQRPDAILRGGKGWEILTVDAIHICEVLIKNNIDHTKKTEHIIEIH